MLFCCTFLFCKFWWIQDILRYMYNINLISQIALQNSRIHTLVYMRRFIFNSCTIQTKYLVWHLNISNRYPQKIDSWGLYNIKKCWYKFIWNGQTSLERFFADDDGRDLSWNSVYLNQGEIRQNALFFYELQVIFIAGVLYVISLLIPRRSKQWFCGLIACVARRRNVNIFMPEFMELCQSSGIYHFINVSFSYCSFHFICRGVFP